MTAPMRDAVVATRGVFISDVTRDRQSWSPRRAPSTQPSRQVNVSLPLDWAEPVRYAGLAMTEPATFERLPLVGEAGRGGP